MSRLPLRLLLASLVAAPAFVAEAQEVGRAGAVNPAARGTPPAQATRTIELGSRVIHRERIQTGPAGSLQLLFLDKTTLNVGPNSDLVIDEFVYDPATGSGRMAASMTRGILRFVGGNVSHTGGATVRTPVATLGIRGGVATIRHVPCAPGAPSGPECGTKAIHHFGIMTVTTGAGTEIIRRAGFVVQIPSAVLPPTPPRRVTQAELAEARAQLTSKPGQGGGSPSRPTEQSVARAGAGTVTAAITPLTPSLQQTTNGGAPLTPPTTIQNVVQLAATTQQQTAAQQEQQRLESERQNQTQPPRPGRGPRVFALSTAPDPALKSNVPYVLGAAVASGNVRITPIMGYAPGFETGQQPGAARTLQIGLGIEGQGAQQRSDFMVSTGAFREGEGGAFFQGGFGSSSRIAGNPLSSHTDGTIASTSVTLNDERVPTAASVDQRRMSDTGTIAPNQAQFIPPSPDPASTYGFQQTFAQASVPEGLGNGRSAQVLTGFSAGIVNTLTPDGAILPPAAVLGTNALVLDPTDSRVEMRKEVVALWPNGPPPGAYESGSYQFGSIDPTRPAQSAYIDDNNFGARQAIGTSDGQTGPLTRVNGGTVTRDTLIMAVMDPARARAAFPDVTLANLTHTRWGFWSAESDQAGGFSDRIHLGTWVAGRVPQATEVPTTGIARYSGHVIASMVNGQHQYVAAGNLQSTVNFGNPAQSTVSVSNFDGRNFAGPMSVNGASLSAQLVSNGVGMGMIGSFFHGATSPVGEMGGSVVITGGTALPGYGGAGSFVGAMVP